MTRTDIPAVEAIIGYHFEDPSLLEMALTHPSALGDDEVAESYERLEFLGDALVDAVVSRLLYERYPTHQEGDLTRMRIALVSGTHMRELSEELGFGPHIRFGSSERGTEARGMASALENVYESITGAIWLDGGYEVAGEWVTRTLSPVITDDLAAIPDNPKSLLQEHVQRDHHVTPSYALRDSEGPAHLPTFTSVVLIGDDVVGEGSGGSQKEAEAAAALDALRRLSYIDG